ncbi:MAG: S9 family peptidase [Bacteroidia bacterium]|nr:S9 family peptidase [Bacteroidia bacterium]
MHTLNQLRKTLLSVSAMMIVSAAFGQAVKNIARPVQWKDNNTLELVGMSDMKRVTYEYDSKTGSLREAPTPERPTIDVSALISKECKNPTFSPDSTMLAYTKSNDLYTMVIKTGVETRHTFDGSSVILNGRASWVYYEEIFGRPSQYKAFWWSPDSKKLAFFKFDDSKVPMFPIYDAKGQHGSIIETRYPKAGDHNPDVTVGIADIASGKIVWADFDKSFDQYFGLPIWTPTSDALLVQWMNRDQNDFRLYSVTPDKGLKSEIYKESQPTWIEWIEEFRTGKEGLYFVRDFDLWEQVYYLDYKGGNTIKLTERDLWGTKLVEVDEASSALYFTSRGETSVRNDVYVVNWKKNHSKAKVEKISSGNFNYTSVALSPDKSQFSAIISNLKTPPASVIVSSGKIKIIESSKGADSLFNALPEFDMTYIRTDEGFKLPASVIWPVNMDRSKRYPVLFYVYGGPNSGSVMDTWRTPAGNAIKLAQEGVIQVTIDHRASGHCGKKGINHVYRDLGNYEIQDYIQWAKFFKAMPFVYGNRFGITGFSYGGTITLLALTDGADYFQFGFAGGGVYDWLLYDSHYTERFMDTPSDNPEGYKRASVLGKVSQYKDKDGSLLYLSHGTGDDNVHMQNTIQLIDALQKEGKHFELMLYPGGMHGYRGYQNDHSDNEEMRFWRKTLLKL